jgi:hypothetical protein
VSVVRFRPWPPFRSATYIVRQIAEAGDVPIWFPIFLGGSGANAFVAAVKASRGAQPRTWVSRSLSPDSSMKTRVRLCFAAFFLSRPAHALPASDRRLVALERATRGALAAESQTHQNPPHLALAVSTAELLLDQLPDPGKLQVIYARVNSWR